MDINIRFIYKDINDNLCIVRPMKEYIDKLVRSSMSLEDIKKILIEKDILPYAKNGEYYETSLEGLPEDRYFRNAWDHNEKGQFQIHRGKAEAIHMLKLRELRTSLLDKLDKDYMKALEKEDKTAQKDIATKKQQLRDMPQTEDLSKLESFEDLKNYIPEYLKETK